MLSVVPSVNSLIWKPTYFLKVNPDSNINEACSYSESLPLQVQNLKPFSIRASEAWVKQKNYKASNRNYVIITRHMTAFSLHYSIFIDL